MPSIIGLGNTTKKMLYPLGMGICSFIILTSYKLLRNVPYTSKGGETRYFHQKPFVIAWAMCMSEATCTLLFFFKGVREYNMNIDEKKEKIETQTDEIEKKEEVEVPKMSKIKTILMILPICFLDCSTLIILPILRETEVSFFELDYRALLILVTSGLSILILKYKFKKYSIAGIILTLGGIVIYTIIEIIVTGFSSKKSNYILLCILLMILVQLMTSLQECFEKYLMEIKKINPFLILSVEGVAGTILLTLSFVPLYFIKCPSKYELHCNSESSPNQSVEDILETLDFVLRRRRYLGFIGLLFAFFIPFNIFRVLTNKNFSPIHRGFADTFGFFLFWILQLCSLMFDPSEIHNFPYFIFGLICFIIIIFGICVFLNIIILRFSKLNDSSKIDYIKQEEKMPAEPDNKDKEYPLVS